MAQDSDRRDALSGGHSVVGAKEEGKKSMSVAHSDVVPMPRGKKHAGVDVESAVIRFSGDSGDGMQLTGSQFTNTTAIVGNDLATFPDFPAEIRAPAGSLAGVSAFQLNFSSREIRTPG